MDASCAALIFGAIGAGRFDIGYFSFLIILYNVLAFAMQAPLGLLIDRLRAPVMSAVAGCILTALSLVVFKLPLLAVCLAGIGNALFHLGGGIISLNLKSGSASLPGIYVAPGALGLFIGAFVGKNGYYSAVPFIVLLVAAALLMVLIKSPVVDYSSGIKGNDKHLELIILLLLVSISIRSLIGMILDYPWKSNIQLLIIMTIAVVLGKAFGGVLGDRIGWAKTAVAGLIISTPLLAFGMNSPFIGIAGVFFFNLTMPVTLVAVSNMLPCRAGFAFGLTTLALIAGALPGFTSFKTVLYNSWIILFIVLTSAFVLYKGLSLYNGSQSSKVPGKKEISIGD